MGAEHQTLEQKTLRVNAYVELPLEDVLHRFCEPGIDALLAAALCDLPELEAVDASVHCNRPRLVANGQARTELVWRALGAHGHEDVGTAVITLLAAHSGREPITELIADVPLGGGPRGTTVTIAHRFLDELVGALAPPVGV